MLNPKYEAYLKTTEAPSNWGFMVFVNKMKREYLGESSTYGVIKNHKGFEDFVKEKFDV